MKCKNCNREMSMKATNFEKECPDCGLEGCSSCIDFHVRQRLLGILPDCRSDKDILAKLDTIIQLLQGKQPGNPVPSEIRIITDDGKKKTSELLDECRKLFPVWCYYDNNMLDKDFPPPEKPASRRFYNTQEADEKLKNKSANDLEKEHIQGITLRERIIFELDYFGDTGKHLDIKNTTLCSGSRDSDGVVPRVFWHGDELYVGWFDPGYASAYLRVREAVS
jgi:hypothetical protein